MDDEAMRVLLAMGIGHTDAAEWIIQNKVFPGTLTRSPALRADIRKSMENVLITDEDGQPMEVVKYSMDRARAERFIIRVTKGLLRHYYPHYDDSQDRWTAIHMGLELAELAKIETLKDQLPHFDQRGDGVVCYKFGFTAEGLTGMWLVLFYGSALFLVTHSHAPWSVSDEF